MSLYFQFGTDTTTPGHTAVIPVTLANTPVNLSAFCIFLTNTAGFGLPVVAVGPAQPNLITFVDDFGNNVYRLTGFVTNDPPIGDGVIVNLTYSIPHGIAPNTYPLQLPASPPNNAPAGPNPEARALSSSALLSSGGGDGQLAINPAVIASSPVLSRAPGMTLKMKVTDLGSVVDGTLNLESLGPGTQGASISSSSGYIFYIPGSQNNDSVAYTLNNGLGDTAAGTITVQVVKPGGVVQTITSTGGAVTLHFAGIPGFQYDIQFTSDLSGSWSTVATRTASADGLFTFAETPASNPAFYRLVQH